MLLSRQAVDDLHYHSGEVTGHAALPLVTPGAVCPVLLHPESHLGS